MGQPRLLFVVNVDWFFLSHRLPIALAAQRAGYEVHLATALTGREAELKSHGIVVHPLEMSRSGTNPLAELATLFRLFRIIRRARPHLLHTVTIKPVLYGGLLARILRIPNLAAISGLGYLFTGRTSLLRGLATRLYRLVLGHTRSWVVVQNVEDRKIVAHSFGVPQRRIHLIDGSGVDLQAYPTSPEPEGPPVVTMAARLLRDKGVMEFCAAAALVRQSHPEAKFLLAGDLDPGNPASLVQADLDALAREGHVQSIGHCHDIPGLFSRSHLVVLPSYREGLPKVLVEAAACGRPVVTTDVPGCRDAVLPGETACLVPAREVAGLVQAIIGLLDSPDRRRKMGERGRRLVEERFDIRIVVRQHLELYDLMAAGKSAECELTAQ